MKKDFLLAGILSLALIAFAFSGLGKTAYAFRQLAFYLVYPSSAALRHTLEYASNLGRFWRELLSSKEESNRLRELLKNKEIEDIYQGVERQEFRDREHFRSLEASLKNASPIKGFSLTLHSVSYRSISPIGWVSRACLDLEKPPQESMAVLVYSSKYRGFVFLGRTLPEREGFGPLTCLEFLTSHQFNIVVRGEDSQEQGLLRGLGEPNRLLLDYLSRDSSLKIGERLVVSSLSQFAPPGIAVGQVIAFENQDPNVLFKRAYVEPYMELGRIREVAILNWSPPK